VEREAVMTAEGVQRLDRELDALRTTGRDEIAQRLREALERGTDLSENAEYLTVQDEQAQLERRIATLEDRRQRATIVKRPCADGTIDVGVHIRIRDRDTRSVEEYDLVGNGEGEPGAGRISRESPIGSALIGRHAGDEVEIETPAGKRRLKILDVQ
jgi:transcription elongation factor GreA